VDYAGAKAAMDTLTIGLAKEVGPLGIRVNGVRPAFIDTEIHATSGNPERARILGKQTPLGREGSADEVAEALVWLLSDASSYVSGALIDMAGGR
jgi:NAD(P)-dependent dehydrogenase (short-subunit alcohol dehydrogenase family)